ncbi:tetratricopeptide repeat protein [Lentisalinibacter orientalis]|uniref:tetratricopeptide repeat protein n=1 Tax=Lentisalinibacter orientalis TaxID=2992241 RepID=UPI0038650AE3
MVEAYHFTAKVERLESGQSQTDPAGDLDYTLRAVPNHHRALYAISRYELTHGVSRWNTARCYFERALAFRPNDPVVRMLFGLHFAIRDAHSAAVKEYRQAESLMPENAELQYNLGLSLFELGDYRAARESAKLAYKNGYPLPGLKKRLEAVGYGWNLE